MLVTGILPGSINSSLWNLTHGEVFKTDPVIGRLAERPVVTSKVAEQCFTGPNKNYGLMRAKLTVAVRIRTYGHLIRLFGNQVNDKHHLSYQIAHCRPSGVYYDSRVLDFKYTCRLYHACPNCLYRTDFELLSRLNERVRVGGYETMVVGCIRIPAAYSTITDADLSVLQSKVARARATLRFEDAAVIKRVVVNAVTQTNELVAYVVGFTRESMYKAETRLVLVRGGINPGDWKVTSATDPSRYLLESHSEAFAFCPTIFMNGSHALVTNIAKISSSMRYSFSR